MSSDSRWTGGIANREWQSGTRPPETVDVDEITGYVKSYLADCKRFDLTPSEDMALKIVFHRGDAQKQAVRQAYRAARGVGADA